jgi:hypothetical protein
LKKLLTLSVLPVALVLLAGVGCGDDDDDTPGSGDYYHQLEDIANRTDDELTDAGDALEATSETDPDYIEVLRDSFSLGSETLEKAHEDVGDLEPPAEAEQAHAEFLSALDAQASNSASLYEGLIEVSTVDEVNDLFDSLSGDFASADVEFEAACAALQGVADTAGAGVDLRCGDD